MDSPISPLTVSVMYCLDSEQGHIFSYNRTFGEAVRTLGWDHRATVRAAARVAELPLGWTRDLGATRNVFKSGLLLKVEKELRLITTLARYLRRLVATETRPIILLLEWFHLVHLFAFCASLIAVPGRRRLSAWFVYRFGFVRRRDRILYQLIHSTIRLLLGAHNVTVFTETDLTAEELRTAFRQPVLLLPMPQIVQPHEDRVRPAWSDSPEWQNKVICWWPGMPAVEKGLAIIERLAGSTGHGASAFCLLADQRARLKSAEGGCEIVLLPDTLTRAEYAGWLEVMDFALLPYSPSAYVNRTSGVFADAICMGGIPVVTAGTWMARELRRYHLDDLVLDWDRPGIFKRLLEIRRDPKIRVQLDRMRAEYQTVHSVAGYARMLKKALDTHPQPGTVTLSASR